MKKTLSLLLPLALALSLVPAALAAEGSLPMTQGEYEEQYRVLNPAYTGSGADWEAMYEAYKDYLVNAYATAHPGELDALGGEEQLFDYASKRNNIERICAEAAAYRTGYPQLWAGFDAEVWFAQGNAAWWDQAGYWKVNGLQSQEEFIALLFAEYVESGVWEAYGDKAEGTVPNPPSWMFQKDYLSFPGDPVYRPENWASIREQRERAEKGGLLDYEGRDWAEGSPAQCYETALIRLKCAENYGEDEFEAKAAFLSAGRAFQAAESGWYDQNRGKDETYYRLSVEKYRAYVLYHPAYAEGLGRGLVPALDALNMTLEDFFSAPYMDRVSETDRALVAELVAEHQGAYDQEKNRITVELDGAPLIMDAAAQVADQRVMVPLRAIGEALGADVKWDPETNGILLDRAGRQVALTIGSTSATVDGETLEMDVAPYADRNRTYVPARYVAEFFGQTVAWNGETRTVEIFEDRTGWEDSGLESWLLPMGSLLGFLNGGDPTRFGFYARPPYTETAHSSGGVRENQTAFPFSLCRETLAGDWEVPGREALLTAVEEILKEGAQEAFWTAANRVQGLGDWQIAHRTEELSDVDKYMWPYTKALSKKWGETGIRAWDLCRAAALTQWGYTAGYVTYNEAMELLKPAAEELAEKFGSWDQVYENFLEGYYWCLREDLGESTVWDTNLGMAWQYLKNSPDTRTLFNDEMFETGFPGKS